MTITIDPADLRAILPPGTRLKLHAFGPAIIRKLYPHPDTKELVADVKSAAGDSLHLSLSYCYRVQLLGAPLNRI